MGNTPVSSGAVGAPASSPVAAASSGAGAGGGGANSASPPTTVTTTTGSSGVDSKVDAKTADEARVAAVINQYKRKLQLHCALHFGSVLCLLCRVDATPLRCGGVL
jgi:hypothetical protein